MGVFLTAEWRHLLMLNYPADPRLLQPYLPNGVELDDWNGTTYLSMVGFLFLRTRMLGLPIPWHTNFEEVNLRFYVRRKAPEGWRRGVVFIRELVPRRAIAIVARHFYNEPYLALPMKHRVDLQHGGLRAGSNVEYGWKHQNEWHSIRAATVGIPQPVTVGSEEEFITEHYWGYTAQKDGGCIEYNVEHPRWNLWQVSRPSLQCDIASLYGESFVGALSRPPVSAFVAEGSAVTVKVGRSF